MSAAATAAGYLYASGRIRRRSEEAQLRRRHGTAVAKALIERKRVQVTYKRKPSCP